MSRFLCSICHDDLVYSDEHRAHVHKKNGSMVADINGRDRHVALPKRLGCLEKKESTNDKG